MVTKLLFFYGMSNFLNLKNVVNDKKRGFVLWIVFLALFLY